MVIGAKIALGLATVFGLPKLLKLAKTANTADQLLIGIKAVNNFKVKLSYLAFDLKISAANPTDSNIIIEQFYSDILLSNSKITTVQKFGWNKEIKANAATILTIPIKITVADLIIVFGTSAYDFFKTGNFPQEIGFEGFVKANAININFDEKIKVTS